MPAVVYEALCPAGNRMQVLAKETAVRLQQTIRILLDTEEYGEDLPQVARYRNEVAQTKAQRDETDVRLMRHVAHCTAGCKRAQGGAHAFAGVNQPGVNSRAPSHQKPPMPGGATLAARLREGTALADLATEYDRTEGRIRDCIIEAGFNSRTGEPRAAKGPLALAFLRIDDQPWADQALCAQTDPESFYPEKGGSTREAKAVCAGCLVQAECLDWALDHDERFGIWGGLSERERRKIKQALGGAA